MPLSKSETQITWGTASSVSIAAGGNATSDVFAMPANAVGALLQIEADNNSATPASDAKLEVYELLSAGDVNGDAADDYDTTGHASLIAVLDVSSGGEDPARRSVHVPAETKGLKLFAKNAGATDGITVRGRIIVTTAS